MRTLNLKTFRVTTDSNWMITTYSENHAVHWLSVMLHWFQLCWLQSCCKTHFLTVVESAPRHIMISVMLTSVMLHWFQLCWLQSCSTDFSYADFSHAPLISVMLTSVMLHWFQLCWLQSCSMLSHSDFSHAPLTSVMLHWFQLCWLQSCSTDFSYADFSHAPLT